MDVAHDTRRDSSNTPQGAQTSLPGQPAGLGAAAGLGGGYAQQTQRLSPSGAPGYAAQVQMYAPDGLAQGALVGGVVGLPSAQQAQAALTALVSETRGDEIARLEDLLDGIVSDGDVDEILSVFQYLAGPTIQAMCKALGSGLLTDLVDNLNDCHAEAFRRETLEVLSAATGMLGDMDSDVLVCMSFEGLAPREHYLLVELLRAAPKGVLEDLLDSDNAAAARAVMNGPRPDYDPTQDAISALGVERSRKASLDEDEGALQDTAVSGQLAKVQAILDEWHVSDADAIEVLDRIADFWPDAVAIRAIARRLESEGGLDTLIDNLPVESVWSAGEPKTGTLLALLSHRAPDKNVGLAESLLSRDLGDWAVTDEEALLAWYLIKAMPAEVQDRFRRLEGGLFLVRMEQEMNAEVTTDLDWESVETRRDEGGVTDVAGVHAEALRESEAAQDALKRLIARFEDLDQQVAFGIYDELVNWGDLATLEAVVRRLDALGHTEALLSELGEDFLFREHRREGTLKILAARDPAHLTHHARQLLSLGIIDWAVTAEEAWFAFHILKALPRQERQAFMESEGGEWFATLEGELSQSMRESQAHHFHEAGADRDAVRAKLLDEATWDPAQTTPSALDGYVRMAIAAGDGRWVFDQSKVRSAFSSFPSVVQSRGLFHPEAMPAYQPELVEGELLEGPLQGFDDWVVQSVDALASSGDIEIGHGTYDLQGVNLAEAQDVMGGHLGGVRFAKHDEIPGGEAMTEASRGANFVDVGLDTVTGDLKLSAPDLRIAAIRQLMGEVQLQTGPGTISGVELYAHWPAQGNPAPAYVSLHIAEIALSDLMLIAPDAMTALKALRVSSVDVEIGRPGVGPEEVAAGVERGELPWWRDAGGLVPLIAALCDLGSLGDFGDLSEQTSALAMSLNVGGVDLEGLVTSDGLAVESVKLTNLSIAGGDSRSAWLRAKMESLDRAIARHEEAGETALADAARGEKAALAAELEAAVAVEAEITALQDTYDAEGQLSEADQARLQELQAQHSGGGYVLDLGGVHIQGLEGQVSAGDISLRDVHGEGESAALGFSLRTVDQFLAEGTPTESDAQAAFDERSGDAALRLDIGALTVDDLSVQGERPTRESVEAELAAVEAQLAEAGEGAAALEARRAELRATLDDLLLVESAEAQGLTTLSPAQAQAYTEARKRLEAARAMHFDRVEVEGAYVQVDAATGELGAGASSLDVRGVELGGEHIADRVSATDVDLRVGGLGNVLASDFSADQALSGGVTLSGRESDQQMVGSLRVEGLVQPDGTIATVEMSELGGTIGYSKDAVSFTDLGLGAFTIGGLDWRAAGMHIRAEQAGIEGLSVTGSAALVEGAPTVVAIEDFRIEAIRATALHVVDEAAGMDVQLPSGVLSGLWAKGVSLDLAAGTFTGEGGLEGMALTDLAVAIEGSLTANASLALSDLRVAQLDDGSRVVSLGDLDAEVDARLADGTTAEVDLEGLHGTVRQDGERLRFDDVGFEALELGPVHYASATERLDVHGKAAMYGLSVDASATLGEGGLSDIRIHDLKVRRIEAEDVELEQQAIAADPSKGVEGREAMTVRLPSATIEGLHVDDMDLEAMTGAVDVDMLAIDDMYVHIGDSVLPTLEATVTVWGEDLGYTALAPDDSMIHIGDLDVYADVDNDGSGNSADIALTGLSAEIDLMPRSTEISELSIVDLTVSAAQYGADGMDIDLHESLSLQSITLEEVILDKTEVEKTPGVKTLEATSLTVTNLRIDTIDFGAMDYVGQVVDAKGDPVGIREISLQEGQMTGFHLREVYLDLLTGDMSVDLGIGGVDMTGLDAMLDEPSGLTDILTNVSGSGLEVQLDLPSSGPMTGRIGAEGLVLSGLEGEVAGTTIASQAGETNEIELEGIEVSLQGTKTEVDVADVAVEDLKVETGGKTIWLDEATAEGIWLEQAPDTLTAEVTEVSTEGLEVDLGGGAEASVSGIQIEGIEVVLEDGSTSVEIGEATATGIAYEDGQGLEVGLEKATLSGDEAGESAAVELQLAGDETALELYEVELETLSVETADGMTVGAGTVGLEGLEVGLYDNGAARVGFDELAVGDLNVDTGDGMVVHADLLALEDFALGLKGLGTSAGIQLLGMELERLGFDGLTVDIAVSGAGGSNGSGEDLILDALDEADGDIYAGYDLGDGNYAAGHVPIDSGTIYVNDIEVGTATGNGVFDFVTRATVGGLSEILAEPEIQEDGTLVLDVPGPWNYTVIEDLDGLYAQPVDLLDGDLGGDGYIDLEDAAEAKLNEDSKDDEDASSRDWLNDVGLELELQLSDGRIGLESKNLELVDSGDGINAISTPSGSTETIGESLTLESKEIRGEDLWVELDKSLGVLEADNVSLKKLTLTVEGLANTSFTVHIGIEDGVISDIRLGDVSLTSEEELKKL